MKWYNSFTIDDIFPGNSHITLEKITFFMGKCIISMVMFNSYVSMTDWWLQPLCKNMKVNWDYYSQCMEKYKQ